MKIDKIALIYIDNKKLLCARSKGTKVYYLPGGKRENNETEEQALIREIKEELDVSLIPDTIKYLETFEGQAYGKPDGVTVRLTCYTGELAALPKPNSEIEEISWLSHSDREKIAPAGWQILDWALS